MNNVLAFDSVTDIQAWALSSLLEFGIRARPRGVDTLELSAVSFNLRYPRKRCVTHPERRWNFPLAVGEFCWHFSGSNQLQAIEYYAKRWKDFAADNSTITGSCYGHRIFTASAVQPSQWQRLIELLKNDPESRRAVLNVF